MSKFRLVFSIIFAKTLTFFLRVLRLGGGTTLAGYILEKRFPGLLKQLLDQIPSKVVITGTNGKTTTQALLSSMLSNSGSRVISNLSGANLSRGILTTLLNKATIFGKLNFDYGIFEIEEGTFPKIADNVGASIIIVTNLFRDQLDAYGEINKTKEYIIKGIEKSPEAKVILNGDDPKVKEVGDSINNEKYYFRLNPSYTSDFAYEGDRDKIITGENVLVGDEIEIDKDLSSSFKFTGDNYKFFIEKFSSPGVHNIYNALAAIQTALIEKVGKSVIINTFKTFSPAFGRGEKGRVEKGDKKTDISLLLIKNPAGFTLTLKMLADIGAKNLMIIINDNTADGKDVSWLWDSKIELINKSLPKSIVVSGTRAEDMLLRIKYALKERLEKVGQNEYEANGTRVAMVKDLSKALEWSVARTDLNETLYILPTYTAMLNIRKIIGKNSKLKNFWE